MMELDDFSHNNHDYFYSNHLDKHKIEAFHHIMSLKHSFHTFHWSNAFLQGKLVHKFGWNL